MPNIAMSAVDIAGFASVVALMVWVGRRAAPSAESYLVADRHVGLLPLVATLVMTEFNTSTLLAFSAAGYRVGPMALSLPFVFLIGLLFYMSTVARPWKRFNRLSVAELFAARYSPTLGRMASALLLIAMTGFSATYVKSLTLIFLPFAPALGAWVLSAALTLVVLSVVVSGGLVSVVRSDLVGFGLTVVLLPLLLAIGLTKLGSTHTLAAAYPPEQLDFTPWTQWNSPALPFRFVTTLIVLTCFTYIAAPWYGQKIFAAKDERTAFTAVGISAVVIFLLYGMMVYGAAVYRAISPPLADAQTVVPAMIATWLPAGLRGFGTAMLFVAALTTLAGVWSAMAAMTAADFAVRGGLSIGGQRALMGGFALLSWLGANLLVDDILNRLILANIPIAALSFALLAGFHWKRATTAGAWASVAIGVAWGIGCFVVVGEKGGYTWPWAMYGLPLIFVTGVAVSLVTSPHAEHAAPPLVAATPVRTID